MVETIQGAMEAIIHQVQLRQSMDGSFRFCFESGLMTDAYMIVMLRALMIHDEDLIRMLAQRIYNLQDKNGSWKLFHDEDTGNLSATVEAYYAMLASGLFSQKSEQMHAAKHFILEHGGLQKSGIITQAILAMTGQLGWSSLFRFPVEFILIPENAPINFFDFVGFARAHLLPVSIASSRMFSIQSKLLPDLSDLHAGTAEGSMVHSARSLSSFMMEAIKAIQSIPKIIGNIPKDIHERASEKAKKYIVNRIEVNGTFYGYASSTYLLIFAWLALGYKREHSVIQGAITGLKSLLFHEGNMIHVQNTTSTVWDTALLSYAIQEAGIPSHVPFLRKANDYLLSRQHTRGGDWQLHNPNTLPGGWGFSDINTFNPDVDDTGAALRAIRMTNSYQQMVNDKWEKGLRWLMSMQNHDGGWPAFEKNTDHPLLSSILIDGSTSILTDPSSVDLTGRVLEFLGSKGHSKTEIYIEKAIDWMMGKQEKNGSWYGRWGVCYIYGTWAAVTGLMAIGIPAKHPVIERAVQWLLSIQNSDGGWGESCKSDQVKTYVSLGHSTPSQTAWALDALISVFEQPIPAVDSGISCLQDLQSQSASDWRNQYPTGAGLPGSLYSNYHSYRYIWPLLAFAHYQKKYVLQL